MKAKDLEELGRLKEIIDRLPADKRQKLLEQAGLILPKKQRKADTPSHGQVILPNKIVTNVLCLHCGNNEQYIRRPRVNSLLVEAGGARRDKERFQYDEKEVTITKDVETRSCEDCKDFIKTFSREELEEKYLVLLKNHMG